MSKKKLKLKKFYLHPVTTFIILTFATIILSGICSLFQMQATYPSLNPTTGQLENTLVTVENLFNFDGIKYIIGNAAKNFMSFTTLSTLLIALTGLGIACATGLIDTFIKRVLVKIDNKKLTFIIIFLCTASSLINHIGYVIFIPIAALVFLKNNRNPLVGIITAFCGVAFGYGATVFVGSMEANLVSTTEQAARIIDPTYHVALSSNLIIILVTTFILSIVGTIIIEKIIVPKLGRYKELNDLSKQMGLEVIEELDEDEEQQRLAKEFNEKKGLKYATITAIIFAVIFIYFLIPNLPLSGMLLDMTEDTYFGQVFGPNSYFQDGFTYMVALFFIATGLAYGFGAKTIKNDKELLIDSSKYIGEVATLIPMVFFATQFVAVFRKTNISTIITAWGANIINSLEFSGLPLIITVVIIVALINLLHTTPTAKWPMLAPIIVPKLMQANISPEFSQFLLRAADSMTKGVTPLLTYFVIYIGYLNIYTPNKKRPITIGESIKLISPYCLIISIVWIVIILLWYLVQIPLGVGVSPTL